MKTTLKQLRRILRNELDRIDEACGCGEIAGDDDRFPLTSDEAYGAGYDIGQDERESFDYSHDIGNLNTDEAMGLGYETGKMGLGSEDKFLSRDESVKAVTAIALHTSCPVTSAALWDAIESLSGEPSIEEDEDYRAGGNKVRVSDMQKLDTEESCGIGHSIGSGDILGYDIS